MAIVDILYLILMLAFLKRAQKTDYYPGFREVLPSGEFRRIISFIMTFVLDSITPTHRIYVVLLRDNINYLSFQS